MAVHKRKPIRRLSLQRKNLPSHCVIGLKTRAPSGIIVTVGP